MKINLGRNKEFIDVSTQQKQNTNGTVKTTTSEHINKNFCDIDKTVDTEVPLSKHTLQDYLKNPIRNTLFISALTEEELQQEIKSLKNSIIIGPQSIKKKLFQTFSKAFSEPLTNLINLSFNKQIFPNILETFQVLPTLKK